MTINKLKEFVNNPNIATELDEQTLQDIGQRVIRGYEEDLGSSQSWMNDVNEVMKLAALTKEKKSYPLPDSANIKFPLITKACYEFSSRTYPEIIRDGKLVKGRVIGKDPTGEKAKQADRVSDFMNYQLLYENQEWELELDRALNLLPLVGFLCKKTYFDPIRKINKSIICDYEDLIVNSEIKSLEDARRISHVLHLRLNDLIEHKNADLYLSKPVDEIIKLYEKDELDREILAVEQHTYLDLDNDGYSEPYIVTVSKDQGRVLRIVARFTEESIVAEKSKLVYIKPLQYFTDYHFLVSPKGKFQSVGFGILMLHLNETVNTILNQLIDAGKLANMQGGYMDSRLTVLGSADSLHEPGQWKKIKSLNMALKDGMLPVNYKEPSSVLYQLLGLLIAASKDLSSSTEVMSGNSGTDNAKSGAVMALIEQGMKVFTSIQRRVYRSLSNEYRKLFMLNSLYLEESSYVEVLDDQLAVARKDFDFSKINIMPVADPNLSSDAQRAAKNQFLMGLIGQPGINVEEIYKRIFEFANIPNPEALLIPKEEQQQPNPEVIKVQADIEARAQELNIKGRELALEEKRFALETYRTECELAKIKADAIKSLAQAEAAEAGTQMQDYMNQLDILKTQLDAIHTQQDKNLAYDQMQHEKDMSAQQAEVPNETGNPS